MQFECSTKWASNFVWWSILSYPYYRNVCFNIYIRDIGGLSTSKCIILILNVFNWLIVSLYSWYAGWHFRHVAYASGICVSPPSVWSIIQTIHPANDLIMSFGITNICFRLLAITRKRRTINRPQPVHFQSQDISFSKLIIERIAALKLF